MKKVFLDTNVVLDYYLDREGFSDDAEAILAYGYNQGCSLYVSSLTCANMAYIGRKKFPGEAIYAVLASLFEFAEITSVDSNAVKSAVTLQAKDFEDALQYFSAKAIGVDCIVTRNVRERKAEYIAQMEKRMRDDYRRRTGKEAESFCVL